MSELLFKRACLCLIAVMLLTVFGVSNTRAGFLFPPKESFEPGQWFLGATPPNYDSNKPPIVFVQGKNGAANSWYGETAYHGMNDMYEKAYNAGYQTVFVQLYDADGKGSHSQWDNGRLLASMLAQINKHFGKKVNIVAHSKGGPDTQAALVHYGAHSYVGRVITLASPHEGSNLADLAYSWYASWLGSLLGQKDDGTFSLQTGEMAKFRSMTDSNTLINKNQYYTLAGTNKGPAFTALAMGGAYLSSYGPNDGLVNEWSTRLPYGTHLFTDSTLDHDNVRMGSKVFSRIEPYLRQATVSSNYQPLEQANVLETSPANGQQIILGGPLQANTLNEKFFSLNQKTNANFTVLTANKNAIVTMISPTGKVIKSKQIVKEENSSFFKGAISHQFNIANATKGTWKINIKSNSTDAFLFVGSMEMPAPIQMVIPTKMKQKSDKIQINKSKMEAAPNLTFKMRVVDQNGTLIYESRTMNEASFTGQLPSVPVSDTYNMTIDIAGRDSKGNSINRTIVQSIFIEK